MATWAELAHLSRIEATAELQRLSRMGFSEASRLLSLLTVDNYVELWPLIAPVLDNIMRAEQRNGRSVLGTYLVATGLAAGFVSSARSRPDLSMMAYRDGRLPSGMPWARLIYGAPQTITARIQMGMSPVQALNMSRFTVLGAINSQAHAEMRMGTKDVLDLAARRQANAERTSPFGPALTKLIEDQRALREARGERPNLQVVPDEGFYPAEHDYRRYIRQPSPGACPWCLMQATRGAVFYTEQTAVSAGHANCKCVVFPEPKPGAYRNTVLIDPAEVKNAVWHDRQYDRKYDIAQIIAASTKIRTDLIRRRPDLVAA